MQKKSTWIIALVIVIVVVGGFFIFHSSKTTPDTSSKSTSSPSAIAAAKSMVDNKVVTTKTSTTNGNYLTDPSDNTLYTDGAGTTGVTNCTGECLTAWPPYIDKGATTGLPTNVSTIKRSDTGQIQYTYKDMPLYYFSSDTKGEATGNGISGFYLAKP
jgi:predicted lipoprotein with Yx(FWY)xxD motif